MAVEDEKGLVDGLLTTALEDEDWGSGSSCPGVWEPIPDVSLPTTTASLFNGGEVTRLLPLFAKPLFCGERDWMRRIWRRLGKVGIIPAAAAAASSLKNPSSFSPTPASSSWLDAEFRSKWVKSQIRMESSWDEETIWKSSNCRRKTRPVCSCSVLIHSWLVRERGFRAALKSQIFILLLKTKCA